MTRSHRDLRNCVAMARSALNWRWLVEQNVLSLDLPKALVAGTAADVLVSSFQGKCGFVMIDQRGFPLAGEVAIHAVARRASARELQTVRLFVAVLTLRRR